METPQQITGSLEYLKASVPIFSIIAVVIAAFLNARYTRKQKIRDELFSYKVKSYMKIAELVYHIKTEFSNRFEIASKNNLSALKITEPTELERLKGQEFISNILFLDIEIQNKLYTFVSEVKMKCIEIGLKDRNLDKSVFMHDYFLLMISCEKLIEHLQNEIGLNKVTAK